MSARAPQILGGLTSAAALALVVAASSANAAPISIIGVQDGLSGVNCGTGNHSTIAGVTEFDFDSLGSPTAGSTCSPSNGPSTFYQDFGAMPAGTYGNLTFSGTGAEVVVGTSGTAGAPWADSTPYLSVPRPGTTGGSETVTINLANDNYFGLYWGSIDSANTITFTLSNGQSYSFDGDDLTSGDFLSEDSLNQVTTATNEYVDFETTAGIYIDSVEFTDGDAIAFEFDNLAYGTIGDPPADPVPEPASLSLFATALMGLGALRRRTRT